MLDIQGFRSRFDFSKTESQSFSVHSIRFAFLLVVFLFTVTFQSIENRIDASPFFIPLYILIGSSALLQSFYFIFFRSIYQNIYITGFLFYFETFYVTGMIYFIGVQQSILIFLYLVNLILCGILFQRKGSLFLALWTSVLFSFMVSLDTSLSGNTAYLAVGVNNLAFFTVAYLSGFLSEQLNFMGEKLEEKVRDVQILKNLNDLILKNIRSGLVTVDKRQRLLQINPSALAILGNEESYFLDKEVAEVLPALDLSNDYRGRDFDIIFQKNGEKRVLNTNISPLKDEAGGFQGNIIHFQDETHLRALEKRVRQSEKMAAIGQLAAGIAHEIRNPLAGISGSIQLMQSGDVDGEQNEKLMAIITREIDRLNNLITEFLDFAKPEAPMEDKIDIGALATEVTSFVGHGQGAEGAVTDIHAPDGSYILGNRDKLKQALLNILMNAFQACEGVESPKVTVDVKSVGDYVVVSILDNGVGIPENLKQRIFEPFHTTKHKGTGLGLAVTHSIIEAHSATVQVESQKGRGTEF